MKRTLFILLLLSAYDRRLLTRRQRRRHHPAFTSTPGLIPKPGPLSRLVNSPTVSTTT